MKLPLRPANMDRTHDPVPVALGWAFAAGIATGLGVAFLSFGVCRALAVLP